MTIEQLYNVLRGIDNNVEFLVDGNEIGEIAFVLHDDKAEILYIDIRPIKKTA